jgi:hypothetical protein
MKNIAIALSFLCLIHSANAQSPERNKAPIKTNVINTPPTSTSEVAERRTRAWEATFDAVKAANSADGFTGEDGELIVKFQSKGQASLRNKLVEDFDLNGIFSYLAIENYDRAVELARGFQAEGPRAIATIAIAEAILHPKSGAASH